MNLSDPTRSRQHSSGCGERANGCGWEATTKTNPPGATARPTTDAHPVPPRQRYSLDAARRLTRQINTRLREQYPGETIRTRMGQDGQLTMTVPTRLATGAETTCITQIVGELLGEPYAASVRPHRRSRYNANRAGAGAGTNATLTLYPAGTTAAATTNVDNAARR